MKKPVYHQWLLNKFEMCGYSAYLAVVEKLEARNRYYAARGIGVHKAREVNFQQKITTGTDLPFTDLADVARDSVNQAFDAERIVIESGMGNFRGHVIDTTIRILDVDYRMLQQQTQPTLVEQHWKVLLDNWPFDLGLTVDLIDDQQQIIDCKTSEKKLTQNWAESEYQPAVYWLGYKSRFGQPPQAFNYHCLTLYKRSVLAYQLKTTRDTKAIGAVLNRFNTMYQVFKTGVFSPARRGDWVCSPKWCGYWDVCPYH